MTLDKKRFGSLAIGVKFKECVFNWISQAFCHHCSPELGLCLTTDLMFSTSLQQPVLVQQPEPGHVPGQNLAGTTLFIPTSYLPTLTIASPDLITNCILGLSSWRPTIPETHQRCLSLWAIALAPTLPSGITLCSDSPVANPWPLASTAETKSDQPSKTQNPPNLTPYSLTGLYFFHRIWNF